MLTNKNPNSIFSKWSKHSRFVYEMKEYSKIFVSSSLYVSRLQSCNSVASEHQKNKWNVIIALDAYYYCLFIAFLFEEKLYFFVVFLQNLQLSVHKMIFFDSWKF